MNSFSLAHWSILVAALLPIVCAGIAKYGMFSQSVRDGGYDNRDPRAWLARQSDWRARANAAQANSFEALPFFIGAVVGLYVGNKASLRSLVWFAALCVNVAILFAG